jgi:tape measure domain-containing protein
MSRTVDERVVSMEFDNKQFENNVQTSIGTLNKLKESLNFTGASKGLENLDTAARKVDMSYLSGAVETVGLKFSAMYSIADQALRNLTSRAMQTAENVIKAFTVDPIKTGLQEYETQIGAVQTILANTQSKGTTLEDVNAALDELNKYADMTIYNFTEMTRNIGTFTAAGVDLDKSVTSIKGIANLAAISGSTSQQASTAMYQLSQALASGKVTLMDWNSVVNAGMGGQVFQDALKRTATQMGINVDAMIEKYGSFRESLTQGQWLTSEVLTETLTQLSGAYSEEELIRQGYTKEQAKEIMELAETAENAATKVKTFTQLMDTLKEAAQSGWTQTWEIIIGDFEEAKELWTAISDIFGGFINTASEARNALLSGALDTNWEKMIKTINEAGIETSAFEKTLQDVLGDHGYDVEQLIAEYGSLEKAFREGAISSDILNEAIDQVGSTINGIDLSGIDETLRKGMKTDDVRLMQEALMALGYDIGEFGADGSFGPATEAAVKAFQEANGLEPTGILDPDTLAKLNEQTNITEESAKGLLETCKGFIDGITDFGGRELIIESLLHILDGIKAVLAPIGAAFKAIFPPTTSEQLYSLIEGFHKLTARFKLLEENRTLLTNIQKTFEGFFSVIKIGWNFIKAIVGGIVDLVKNFSGLGSGILSVTGSLGEWLAGINSAIEEGDLFGKTVDKITGFIQSIIDKIKEVVKFFKVKIAMPGFEGFLGLMRGIWDVIQKVGSKISGIGTSIGGIFSNAFRSGDFVAGLDILNGGILAAVLLSIKNFVGGIGDVLDGAGGIFDGLVETLGAAKGALEAWQSDLKANTLLKIAGAVAILAGALVLLAFIEPERLNSALGGITMLFVELMGAMSVFGKLDIGKGLGKTATAMIAVSAAVFILAGALKTIASLSPMQLMTGLIGVAGLLGLVVGAAALLSKTGKVSVKSAVGMVVFAAAVKILASACRDLGNLSLEQLGKGLIGVGALLAAVSLFLNNTKFSKRSMTTAIGLVILSSAIKILASACNDFAQMEWEEIGKGLAAIAALLLELSIFTKLSGGAKGMISSGLGMIAIAYAMTIFAESVNSFSTMGWDQLGKGLVGVAGCMVAVALAMKLMPKNLLFTAMGFAIVAGSLIILADILTQMGGMSWEEIGKSLAVLGGSLIILAVGLNAMTGAVAGSAALILAAGALLMLTPVLTTLGAMSWGSIIKGLVGLAGIFVVVGVAGMLLAPIVPVIIGLSGALVLLGVGVLAIGAGLAAAALGLGMLAAGATAGVSAIVASISAIILGVADLIPAIAERFGQALIALCNVIIDGAPAIGEAVKVIVLTLIDVLVTCVPALADGALKLIVGMLEALATNTPQIVDNIMLFLINLIDSVAARTPELVASVVNLLVTFFASIIDALTGIDVGTLVKAAAGVAIMAALMAAFSALAPLVPMAMIGVLGMGLVIAELALVLAAVGALAQIPGLNWLINEGGELMESIGTALGRFVGGIIGGIAQGATSALPQIGTDLSDFMTNLTPFLDGAKSLDETTINNIGNLVSVILGLTAANVLESITSWITGGSSFETFAAQLVPFGESMVEFSSTISGKIDEGAVTAAANAGKTLSEMAATIPGTGGLFTFFTGDNSMSTFGTQIVAFGTAMADFSTAVSGKIDEASVTAATTAGAALVAMATDVPNSGGLIDFFVGRNDLVTFGSQLKTFGTAMADFSTEVSGKIDATAITAAASAGKDLAEMADTIPNSGGLITWFTGDNDMTTFGTQLTAFGGAIKGFSDSVSGLDIMAVAAGTSAATSLVTLANTVASDELYNLSSFGGQVTQFGLSMQNLGLYLADLDTAKLRSTVTQLSRLVFLSAQDLTTIETFSDSLTSLGETGIDDFIATFETAYDDIVEAGKAMMGGLVSGVDEAKSDIKISFLSVIVNAIAALRNAYNDFYDAGEYLVAGFASGIKAGKSGVVSAAVTIATAAITALNAALLIKSPSRVAYSSGGFFGEGFVNGIDEYGRKSYLAGASIADSARTGLSKAISKISSVLNNDIDTQPTIRPVLDLSDVTAGAGAIDSMLSMRRSVGVMANIDSIHTMMNTNQNGGNDDVVSAIEALGRSLGGRTGDTYQINGITYDDGSNITDAVRTLVRAARVERRT